MRDNNPITILDKITNCLSVVYFNQLSGAACSWKLVFPFLRCFKWFLFQKQEPVSRPVEQILGWFLTIVYSGSTTPHPNAGWLPEGVHLKRQNQGTPSESWPVFACRPALRSSS